MVEWMNALLLVAVSIAVTFAANRALKAIRGLLVAWTGPDLQERAEQRAASRRRSLALFRGDPVEEPEAARPAYLFNLADCDGGFLVASERFRVMAMEAFAVPSQVLFGYNAEAKARSFALLRAWLSPVQLAEFEKTGGKSFTVTGSQGTRWRISTGLTAELADDGAVVALWCFGPQGELPIGDVMLARKIALETDEAGTRAIANRQTIHIDGLFTADLVGMGIMTTAEARSRAHDSVI
jgi:hypothetical protein